MVWDICDFDKEKANAFYSALHIFVQSHEQL
jgi:hypothetical protein